MPVAASVPVIVTTYDPAVVDAVELTVSVDVAALVPVISSCEGTLQVIGLVAFAGEVVTEHYRFTSPAKLPVDVAVMVAVLPVVAPAVMLSEVAFNVKPDPFMVTVVVPVDAA